MPGKMARSDPSTKRSGYRGAGSGQHLASVLQEGRENANIDAGLGIHLENLGVDKLDLSSSNWGQSVSALPLTLHSATRPQGGTHEEIVER